MHINGANTPTWDDSTVTGPDEDPIEDLRCLLNAAQQRNLTLGLWSFDMLCESYDPEGTNRTHTLLTQDVHLQSYIDYALVPMVEALGNRPALLA